MTRRRRLRPEEQDLWQQVARSADPLHKTRHPRSEPETSAKTPSHEPAKTHKPVSPFALGERALPRTQTHILPKTTKDHLHDAPVRMDAKAFTRLKRGKLEPEARLDLHGLTVDRAHGELTGFILRAQTRGFRLVLVITGKGQREDPYDPMPRRRGILKTQVPVWLRMPPLAQAVLQVSESHRKHGGEGAYYIYLRRNR